MTVTLKPSIQILTIDVPLVQEYPIGTLIDIMDGDVRTSSGGDRFLGIIANPYDPETGLAGVCVLGIINGISLGATQVGSPLRAATTTPGTLGVLPPTGTPNRTIVGFSLSETNAAGEYVQVLLTPTGYIVP